MWKSLSKYNSEIIYRGTRIRVKLIPNHNGEDQIVDFMVFHALNSAHDGYSLLRISGYKAGHLGVTLPFDSKPPGHNGISVNWLRQNWKTWMPVDGNPKAIWIGSRPRRAREPSKSK